MALLSGVERLGSPVRRRRNTGVVVSCFDGMQERFGANEETTQVLAHADRLKLGCRLGQSKRCAPVPYRRDQS